MYLTRQQRRNQEAEHRRQVYANWKGPRRPVSDIAPPDARERTP